MVVQTLNRQIKIYTIYIYLWHIKCSNLAEVRWPLWHIIYMMCTELLYCIWKPVGKFAQGFPWEDGGLPHTNKKFTHLPPHHHIFIPSRRMSIQRNKKIKTSFLAVVIVPVPFHYSFKTQIILILILIDVSIHNFSIVKITPPQVFTTL